jgi:hypothetical protein
LEPILQVSPVIPHPVTLNPFSITLLPCLSWSSSL